jgi:hypothetical protein
MHYAIRHPGGQIDVSITQTGREVRLQVADDGIGIAPAERERVRPLLRRRGACRMGQWTGPIDRALRRPFASRDRNARRRADRTRAIGDGAVPSPLGAVRAAVGVPALTLEERQHYRSFMSARRNDCVILRAYSCQISKTLAF